MLCMGPLIHKLLKISNGGHKTIKPSDSGTLCHCPDYHPPNPEAGPAWEAGPELRAAAVAALTAPSPRPWLLHALSTQDRPEAAAQPGARCIGMAVRAAAPARPDSRPCERLFTAHPAGRWLAHFLSCRNPGHPFSGWHSVTFTVPFLVLWL